MAIDPRSPDEEPLAAGDESDARFHPHGMNPHIVPTMEPDEDEGGVIGALA